MFDYPSYERTLLEMIDSEPLLEGPFYYPSPQERYSREDEEYRFIEDELGQLEAELLDLISEDSNYESRKFVAPFQDINYKKNLYKMVSLENLNRKKLLKKQLIEANNLYKKFISQKPMKKRKKNDALILPALRRESVTDVKTAPKSTKLYSVPEGLASRELILRPDIAYRAFNFFRVSGSFWRNLGSDFDMLARSMHVREAIRRLNLSAEIVPILTELLASLNLVLREEPNLELVNLVYKYIESFKMFYPLIYNSPLLLSLVPSIMNLIKVQDREEVSVLINEYLQLMDDPAGGPRVEFIGKTIGDKILDNFRELFGLRIV